MHDTRAACILTDLVPGSVICRLGRQFLRSALAPVLLFLCRADILLVVLLRDFELEFAGNSDEFRFLQLGSHVRDFSITWDFSRSEWPLPPRLLRLLRRFLLPAVLLCFISKGVSISPDSRVQTDINQQKLARSSCAVFHPTLTLAAALI